MKIILLALFLFINTLLSAEKNKIYFDIAPTHFEYSDFYSSQDIKQQKEIDGLELGFSLLKPSSNESNFYLGMGGGAILNKLSPLVKDSHNLYNLHLLIAEYNFKYITIGGNFSIHHFGKTVPAIGKSFGGSVFYNHSEKLGLGVKLQEGRVDADPNANVERYPKSDFSYSSLVLRFVF